jgi:hypothetical protein
MKWKRMVFRVYEAWLYRRVQCADPIRERICFRKHSYATALCLRRLPPVRLFAAVI